MPVPPTADVVIVGAGPAGAAAAITLAEAGRRVVLVDKATFPRDKICGDGLTTGALRLLERLGVEPAAVGSWTPVEDIHVSSPSRHVATFPLPRGRGAYAVVTRRMDLDAAIVDRARAVGVQVVEGAEVVGAEERGDRVVLGLADGSTVAAPYVIAADGMWSPLRKLLGTAVPGYLGEWHAFRQYFRHTGPQARQLWVWFEPDLLPGYAWSFPLPDGGANVGFGIQRGAKIATKEMKALWPELLARPHIAAVLGPDAEPESRHQAWPIPARVDDITLAAGRVLWVGDAAAATDPMTGEGIGQALQTGVLAAEAVLDGGPNEPAAVRAAYEAAVARELAADHKMSLLLIRALKHRRGARIAIRVADATPWTRRNFARWLFEDEPRAIAVTPRRWHRRILRRDGAFR
ncbi:geranylgeranyl reductase family protein [Aquihabitans sp. G128]|uniref:NAD(P)/FAD-dependent oxidoreductase n=1 Tax=Aquihabitans sp. G128 TaxID=2849779 RepID=UPI001C223744|nr:geranylgeranyl reductase family protein [Aquihabitans sp. G128]QXC61503.1 geranylgeranyl reductase family protein [Aquihabitans sp. G128]